jgi:tRNA (guanine10-N2)-methyltransferase
MANQGQCKEGDLVYDPFVGTGSIAIACQHFGSCVLGSDIDMRVLKGYGVGRKTKNTGIEGLDKIEKFDIHTNFKHYKLPMPDFLAMDISALQFNMQLQNYKSIRPIFDAIVCDPPYGVRARS